VVPKTSNVSLIGAVIVKTLPELWQYRSKLSEKEWAQLYQLVYIVLKRCRCPELKSLPLDITDYIDEFFCDKVFLPTNTQTFEDKELFSEHALIVFFRNYLRDLLDDAYIKKKLPLEDESDNKEGDTPAPDELMLLQEAGLTLDQVSKSASKFLSNSEEWVRLYLGLHTCPDKENKIALSNLAKIYQIPAHHARARQLGITRKKGEFEQGYEKTLIGKWLLSLGILLKLENQEVIEVAFKILCWQALSIYVNIKNER
jgi:hypothetical protein